MPKLLTEMNGGDKECSFIGVRHQKLATIHQLEIILPSKYWLIISLDYLFRSFIRTILFVHLILCLCWIYRSFIFVTIPMWIHLLGHGRTPGVAINSNRMFIHESNELLKYTVFQTRKLSIYTLSVSMEFIVMAHSCRKDVSLDLMRMGEAHIAFKISYENYQSNPCGYLWISWYTMDIIYILVLELISCLGLPATVLNSRKQSKTLIEIIYFTMPESIRAYGKWITVENGNTCGR